MKTLAKEKSSSLLLALKKKGSDTLDDIYCTLSHNFVEVFVVVSAAKSKKKKILLGETLREISPGNFSCNLGGNKLQEKLLRGTVLK